MAAGLVLSTFVLVMYGACVKGIGLTSIGSEWGRRTRAWVVKIGAVSASLAKRLGLSISPGSHLRVGVAVVALGIVIVLDVATGLVLAAVIATFARVAQSSTERNRRVEIDRTVFLATNLFVVALAGGNNVHGAVLSVAKYCPGPLGEELRSCAQRLRNGMGLLKALALLRQALPDDARVLVSILMSGERYGAPLSDVLDRLGQQSHIEHGRRAERVAKRLSVQLLFPLAGLTLPSFALLTLAPLLASALGVLAS